MQIFSINNYQPNFKALIIDEKARFSPEQEKIVNKIKSEMALPRKNKNEYISPIERAERNGYDVFVTKGTDKDSVQLNLAKNYKNRFGETVFTDYISVAEYNSKEPFNLLNFKDIMLDIENDPKDLILNSLLTGIALTAIIIALFFICKPVKTSFSRQKLDTIKEQTFNTIKTLPEKTINIRKLIFK